jgi:hypothetical protein
LYDAIANVGSHIAVTGAHVLVVAAVGFGLLLPAPANCVDREWYVRKQASRSRSVGPVGIR